MARVTRCTLACDDCLVAIVNIARQVGYPWYVFTTDPDGVTGISVRGEWAAMWGDGVARRRVQAMVDGASLIAPETPFILTVRSYGSIYAMEQAWEKIGADTEYQKAVQAFQAQPGLSYMRVETQLLRAFEGFPKVVAPPLDDKKAPRVFELRTYESNNWGAMRKKIGMFDTMGEIRIFKKVGLLPVFFGETVFGPNQPSITYLLAYDDLAARERNWRAFASDPEWLKLRATEGYSDAEIVSNISNIMFSPLPFSQIR